MDVKTLCLGILSRGDATGYEIKKICEEGPFAHFYAAGFGSIYPALNRLCEDRLVSVNEVVQDGRPAKKVYTVTPAGRLALSSALARPPASDRLRSDFLFITFFAELLPAREIDRLIGDRLTHLLSRIAEMQECRQTEMPDGAAFTLGYGIAIYQAAADYLEQHRHELVGQALRHEMRRPASIPGTGLAAETESGS